MPLTPNKVSEDEGYQNTPNFGQNTKSFCKNWTTILTTTTSESFYIIFVDIFFSNH